MPKTILGIGAHYDDCIFGISGTLLKAVRKGHRVVIYTLIGDYSNWKPVAGREKELVEGTIEICKDYGVEMRFGTFAEMNFDFNTEAKKVVSEAVADILPDIAFMHWPRDVHSDHEVASQLSKVALRHGDRLLSSEAADKWYGPARIYQYDNGPWHTEGFEPDTYYDVSDVWVESTEWIGKLMALVQNKTYDPKIVDPAVKVREVLLAYRGAACGIDYAEAFRAGNAYAQDIL